MRVGVRGGEGWGWGQVGGVRVQGGVWVGGWVWGVLAVLGY